MRGTSGSVARGKREGQVIWDYNVQPVAQRLSVGGGFAVLSAGAEIHILGLSTGRLVLPPIVMGSMPMLIELSAGGLLMAVCRDGSLNVWNLAEESNCAQTTLRNVCDPGEVTRLGARAKTGEPFVKLRSGRLLLFHRGLQRWIELSSERGPSWLCRWDGCDTGATSSSVNPHPSMQKSKTFKFGDGCNLESDLLVSACLGEAQEFLECVEAVMLQLAVESPPRLRSWCATILDPAAAKAGKGGPGLNSVGSPLSWFHGELVRMGLDGKELVTGTVLPALAGLSAAHGLRTEVEEMMKRQGSHEIM